MVKVPSPKNALYETKRKWAEKLKHIDLNQLKRVRTFSKGNHSHVSLVQLDDHPDSVFALKTLQKAKIKRLDSREKVFSEKNILSEVESDFVIKMYRTFKDKKYLYFLTEYCPGGDLLYKRFSEDAAKFYLACTIEALDCLHSLNIVHNDIKPGNLVLDNEGYAKLIDMGFAEKLERGKMSHTSSGTIHFIPPETSRRLLKKFDGLAGRDRAADLWALGVLLYKFLSGVYPFQDVSENNRKICMNIERGIDSVQFPGNFSAETIDFIRDLCAYDPKRRLGYESVDEIRKHRWFQTFDWEGLRDRELKPPIIPKVNGATDTQNFRETVQFNSDGVLEDESDWDMDF